MAVLFDSILTKGIRSGQIPAQTAKARDWYRQTAKDYGKVKDNELFGKGSDKGRMASRPLIGGMYMYEYMAKGRKTLPYFDMLPLIFPFKTATGGFYGLNMHYLPLPLRAKLMDALYDITNNDKYDESTKLKINYAILSKSAKFEPFKPCVKRYLTSQVRSKFMYIYPSEWDIALFLPTERFQGASKTKVWSDSKKKIG